MKRTFLAMVGRGYEVAHIYTPHLQIQGDEWGALVWVDGDMDTYRAPDIMRKEKIGTQEGPGTGVGRLQ